VHIWRFVTRRSQAPGIGSKLHYIIVYRPKAREAATEAVLGQFSLPEKKIAAIL
jgi:hypothetical protein